MNRRPFLLTLIALTLAACDRKPPKPAAPFNSVDITGADYAKELSLPDFDGKTRTLSDFKGKVTVVFFGYTQCPDVCPTTMSELAQIKQALGADGAKLQAVFVTVDPDRDTPELLKSYVTTFDPGFVALRGSPEQLKAVSRDFKVFYAKVPGRTEGSYTMDHTAGSYVFDTHGRVRLFVRYGQGTQALMADIKQLLAEG